MNIKRDGHVHSHYCPHGTKDAFQDYLENAIIRGIEEITFTEHLMFPREIVNEEFYNSCAPSEEELEKYFQEIANLKDQYGKRIKINTGLEVDYIEGYEKWIKQKLDQYGPKLNDGILSIHFVKVDNKYYAVDGLEDFEELLKRIGSLEKVYDLYFDTVLKAIKSDLGEYKPKRIGHPTLIRIFNQKYPHEYRNEKKIYDIVRTIKEEGYEIDINTAGLRKPYCHEIYPSGYFFSLAKEMGLKMVYGSDAHKADDVGRDFYENL